MRHEPKRVEQDEEMTQSRIQTCVVCMIHVREQC